MAATLEPTAARGRAGAAVALDPDRPATESDIPPGWDENPTSFHRRAQIATLAGVGLAVSVWLLLYQLRATESVWDPFFGDGSLHVLDATYPVPDSAAGVIAYGTEWGLCLIGGAARWRTLPWTAILLGLVSAVGLAVSVVLLAVQPLVVGHWCTLCLTSAALSFVIYTRCVDEALAGLQAVARARARGSSWRDAVLGRLA